MSKRVAFSIAILAAVLLFATLTVRAQEAFETQYSVSYKIAESGETLVEQAVSIINKEGGVIPARYTLIVKQKDAYDVSVREGDEETEVNVNRGKDEVIISTEINKKSVGVGKETKLTVVYKSKSIATRIGDVWNINIPKASLLPSATKYNITISVPGKFGPKIFVSPKPAQEKEMDGNFVYKFNKGALEQVGVSAAFGNFQTINFNLKYSMENKSRLTSIYALALPPDVPGRQQVSYKSLDPKPLLVSVDPDGNFLAHYKLRPQEKLNVVLVGSARTYSFQIDSENGGMAKELPRELIAAYTGGSKYWETKAPEIKKTVAILTDKDKTVSENAQSIYNFVINTLEYDFTISAKGYTNRQGARKVLIETQRGACMEFSDLFITLARAAGIPAREINGYAIIADNLQTPLSINLDGGDFLHAWVQYYDPNFGWVQVDPTWGSTSQIDYFTKLDNNHLVFVIKGRDPDRPLPAGMYRTDSETAEKQVDVSFAQNDTKSEKETKENFVLYKARTLNPIALLQGKRKLYVENIGRIAAYNVGSTKSVLPPFGLLPVYVEKASKNLIYETFHNDRKALPIVISDKTPPSFQNTDSKTLLITVLSALGLCTSFYALSIYPKTRQKLLDLRHRLLRVLGQ